jgi:hypothetical protein
MKQSKAILILSVVLMLIPMSLQAQGNDCVNITSRHYYARDTHNDYLVHDIEMCLTDNIKSVTYGLPPLAVPLTLENSDGEDMWVTITELESTEEIIVLSGSEVTIELPVKDGSVRYKMTVVVSNESNGIIAGSIEGQEIGKILLIDEQSDMGFDTLQVSLGGISGEWWFELTERPDNGVWFLFSTINEPDSEGEFEINGWNLIPTIPSEDELAVTHSPLVIEEWLSGGYFVIQATFFNP